MKSILNQTYSEIEYIVIDGNSTDDTLNIVKSYEPKFEGRMRWISEPDDGIYDAMNKGIKLANGILVGILNSDDYYLPNTVQNVVNRYKEKQFAGVFFGDVILISKMGKRLMLRKSNIPQHHIRDINVTINHPSWFVKLAIYKRYGYYDQKAFSGADLDLFLRLRRAGVKFEYIEKPLALFRLGGYTSNFSFCEINKRVRQKYYIMNKNDFPLLYVLTTLALNYLRLLRNWIFSLLLPSEKFHKLRHYWLSKKT